MTPKFKMLLNLAVLRGNFDQYGGQEGRFMDFIKVVLELFKKCLGIIFELKMHTSGCILCSKTSQNEICPCSIIC